MKKSEITIGMRLWAKVSGARVEVEVVTDTGRAGRRYRVKRTDTGAVLPGLRAGTALHPGRYTTAPGAFAPTQPKSAADPNTRCAICNAPRGDLPWTANGGKPAHVRCALAGSAKALEAVGLRPPENIVHFCSWCPDPANPSLEFHPNGSPVHSK